MSCPIVNQITPIIPIIQSTPRNLKHYFGGYGVSVHLFPFRTEKLSLTSPMILHLFVEK